MELEWDIDKMEIMKDDCLEFIRVVYLDLYRHKFFKICSLIFLTFHVPIWAEQYYQYVKTFDPLMVTQYGPTSLVFLYAFMCIFIPIVFEKHFVTYFSHKEKLFWSFNTASEELRKNMLADVKFILLIAKFDLFLGILTYILYVTDMQKKNESEFMYQVTFIKKHFPTYSNVLIIIFYASVSYMIIPMMQIVFMMVYVGQHFFYQTDMFSERVAKVTENYSKNINLFYNERYQQQVFKRLRFICLRGMALKRMVNQQVRDLHPLFVMFSALGMCLVVCFVLSWRLIKDIDYPSFGMMIIISGFTSLLIIETGSLVESKSIRTYRNLCMLPWYTFSVLNQKFFLFLIFHANIPVILSPFRDFPINRTLIVQFYKVAYSVYALASSMGDTFK